MSTVSSPNPIAPTPTPTPTSNLASVFTIIGGTTIPDHAEIVRTHCREGGIVELRRSAADEHDDPAVQSDPSLISVWLQCPALLGLVSVHKKIGHVPTDTAKLLEPLLDESATVVARGTVRTVYAPVGRDEAVVTVEITPPARRAP